MAGDVDAVAIIFDDIIHLCAPIMLCWGPLALGLKILGLRPAFGVAIALPLFSYTALYTLRRVSLLCSVRNTALSRSFTRSTNKIVAIDN